MSIKLQQYFYIILYVGKIIEQIIFKLQIQFCSNHFQISLIEQFKAVTNSTDQQAKRYLEIANNDINTAVLLFFDSNDQMQQEPQNNQSQITKNKQSTTKSKQNNNSQKNSSQQQTKQSVMNKNQSNFHQFKPQETSREQMVNGGENVAVYRPDPNKVRLTLYQNGFLLNNKFYDYSDPVNLKYRDDIMKSQQLPVELLQSAGLENINSQSIDAQVIDNSQMKYYPEKEKQQEQLPEFQGSGNIINGKSLPFKYENQTVNIDLARADTRIKIKADKNYIIKCSQKHKLCDILNYLVGQKHLNQIPVDRIQAQTASGKQINLNQTIMKSEIQGKAISLFYIE